MDSILPQSVANVLHVRELDVLMGERLDAIEIETLLVYLIDLVDESALYVLADQFQVLGYNGWRSANTVLEKREIIKQAINLQKRKGTVWAVKEAMRATGFQDAQLIEGVGHWAEFDIVIDISRISDLQANALKLTELVEEYKPARSHLVGVSFSITITETLGASESLTTAGGSDFTDGIGNVDFRYNGAFQYNGVKQYNGTPMETLNLQFIYE